VLLLCDCHVHILANSQPVVSQYGNAPDFVKPPRLRLGAKWAVSLIRGIPECSAYSERRPELCVVQP